VANTESNLIVFNSGHSVKFSDIAILEDLAFLSVMGSFVSPNDATTKAVALFFDADSMNVDHILFYSTDIIPLHIAYVEDEGMVATLTDQNYTTVSLIYIRMVNYTACRIFLQADDATYHSVESLDLGGYKGALFHFY